MIPAHDSSGGEGGSRSKAVWIVWRIVGKGKVPSNIGSVFVPPFRALVVKGLLESNLGYMIHHFSQNGAFIL